MISGIMPCSGWTRTGYPWRLAMRCWARVCDELVVMTHHCGESDELFKAAAEVVQASTAEGRKCDVFVRSVDDPPLVDFGSYGSYLFYGICIASDPDWALAVEADYLISPGEAAKLRAALLLPGGEVVMAKAVTMNYLGTRKVFNPDFQRWYTPFDGFSWDRPIGCRPGLGVFPAPFNGVDRANLQVNCEGYVALRRGRWGSSFNSKFLNHNPFGFDVLRTGAEFEHLTFTRFARCMPGKLSHQYMKACGMTAERVLAGDEAYGRDYAELRQVASDYAEQAEELAKTT